MLDRFNTEAYTADTNLRSVNLIGVTQKLVSQIELKGLSYGF